jgi:hypothetical protein
VFHNQILADIAENLYGPRFSTSTQSRDFDVALGIDGAEYVQLRRHDATVTYERNAYSLERVKRVNLLFHL